MIPQPLHTSSYGQLSHHIFAYQAIIQCKPFAQKLLMIIFLGYFFIFILYCQHSNIISYSLFSNTIFGFYHPLCNLKRFLQITSPTNICKYNSLSFKFRLLNSVPSLFLWFQVLLFIFVFLCPLFPKFLLFKNTWINIIIPPLLFLSSCKFCCVQNLLDPQQSFFQNVPVSFYRFISLTLLTSLAKEME